MPQDRQRFAPAQEPGALLRITSHQEEASRAATAKSLPVASQSASPPPSSFNSFTSSTRAVIALPTTYVPKQLTVSSTIQHSAEGERRSADATATEASSTPTSSTTMLGSTNTATTAPPSPSTATMSQIALSHRADPLPFKKGSIFYDIAAQERQQQSVSPQPQPQPQPPPAKSKNSIFDVYHAILKPAVHMDGSELELLRKGDLALSQATERETRSENSTANPGNQDAVSSPSISVPIPKEPVALREISPLPPPPITTPSSSTRDVEAAFLTNANTSSRRGFVELDESLYNLLPPPSSRQSQPPQPPSPQPPQQSLSPSPSLPSTAAPPKKSAKLIAAEQNAIRKKRKGLDDLSVVTSPALWDTINLTFLPTKRNFLGEGRYSQVFLGFYTISESPSESRSPFPMTSPRPYKPALPNLTDKSQLESPSLPSPASASTDVIAPEFLPCAVKRLHQTQEAQSIGLSEVYILRKLSPLHPNIVKFIGVKDEAAVDNPKIRSELASSSSETPAAQSEREAGQTLVPDHARQRSSDASSSDSPKRKAPVDPSMHLLVLLEYLPKGNMWDWVVRNKQSVGRRLWIKWARQLASAVECMHAQGIVHHDIKPHNILLSEYLDVRLADFGNACFVPEQTLLLPDQPTTRSSSPLLPSQPQPDANSASPHFTPASLQSQPQPKQQQQQLQNSPILSATPASPIIPTPCSPVRNLASFLTPLQIPPTSTTTASSVSSQRTASPIIPGSPSFPDSQTLHAGLARGTAPYSAPELFTPQLPYSFPIDIYSLGVTLYTVLTAIEPFSLARTNTQLYMGARRGFFESGLQAGVGPEGILYPPAATSPTSPSSFATQQRPQDPYSVPIAKGFPRIRFLNGDPVENRICEILHGCLNRDPAIRYSATQLVRELDQLEVAPM
ncbi:hypothetical protein PhCBS80983_g01749 [Powellomyces hirtus]|uniref:Protein kinase domain-containing protein n=1 Tax=Powellomyces hirtus TaxID=109895 RepID=A0A507E9Y2_9FUNG|nr:hypothetical protein PhCBS80983_g01749 [Powellomyces hirtus]